MITAAKEDDEGPERDSPGWRYAVTAGILGWVLDAFDFFVVVFLLTELAEKFHVGKAAIVWSMTLTLAMRPVGAVLFGALADRFGRRRPLVVCVIYFSIVTALSAVVPAYWMFLVCRLLYGIGMGGYWGIGASYAMESAPRRRRGLLSGMMQGGYPGGYLMAAVGMQTIVPRFGWQAMFFVGLPVAAAIVLLTARAPESEVWEAQPAPTVRELCRTVYTHKGIFGYLLLLMTAMTCLSHGTQDLYPDFLKTMPWMAGARVLGMKAAFGIPVIYNVGAILGALGIGHLSERTGRRYAVMLALGISLLSLPLWAFGGTLAAIVVGSYLMQTGVQGAFGVVPAHLNELSPSAVRSLFPGFAYQLGALCSSPVLPVQNLLRIHLGYPRALASFELGVIATLFVLFLLGPENTGKSFRGGSPGNVAHGVEKP